MQLNRVLLYLVFFISGVPALIYQIVWQRSLFSIYGVNMESVTVVVTAFMLGLGLGSLLGGWISKQSRVPILAVFALAELIVSLFGFFSLTIFSWAGSYTLSANIIETGLITFSLVLLPTMLMGATLPLLVTYLVQRRPNVGRATGTLYFFNTLGSAAACLILALYLMMTFGMRGTVTLAASLNLLVGLGALALFLYDKKFNDQSATQITRMTKDLAAPPISFPLAVIIGFAAGFVALSYEIIWIKVYQIGLTGSARAFPLVLSAYLAGLAFGALAVRRFCPDEYNKKSPITVKAFVIFFFFANLLGFLLVPAATRLFQHGYEVYPLLLMVLTAGCLGATLPLLSHMAIPPDSKAGFRLSIIYFSNIVGSALGSFITGYFLLAYFSLPNIAILLAIVGFVITLVLILLAREGINFIIVSSVLMIYFVFFFTQVSGDLYDRIYERLIYKSRFKDTTEFANIVENRHGLVTVSKDGTVYGNGFYDGELVTDLIDDGNHVMRAYAVNAFHHGPQKNVLVIGLSSGSYVQVLANNPEVEKVTVVEINPGYLDIIKEYDIVESILSKSNVDIIIDDGRRWLKRHPDEKFDVIFMNTTWHWRAFTTNLLSVEFLNLVRDHLKPDGIFFYNITFSDEAKRTATKVFPYAYNFVNFMIVSDSPINIDTERLIKTLEDYTIDGEPVMDLSNPQHQAKMDEILGIFEGIDQDRTWTLEMKSRDYILEQTEGVGIVTDDNMLTEWRR